MQDDIKYVQTTIESLPKDEQGRSLVDVFVYLPTSKRYVKYLAAGDPLDEHRLKVLSQHQAPSPYVIEGQKFISAETLNLDAEINDNFKGGVLGKAQEEELKTIFKSFLDPTVEPGRVLDTIEKQAKAIIATVAPETENIKASLISNVKYLHLMNDAAAISSIAILVAMATGFDSRKSYRDLSYACLVMDSSLVEVSENDLQAHYKNPASVSAHIQAMIKNHPARSFQLASEKLPSLSDVTMQLILNHHELYNGKGYPRGVRSESLFPMVKVLSLAVDIFENIKREELNGVTLQFADAVMRMTEDGVEGHLRRHSKKIVDQVLDYLGLNKKT